MTQRLKSSDVATDDAACWVMKDEVVSVEFAAAAGVLETGVGFNHYAVGRCIADRPERRSLVRIPRSIRREVLLRGNAGDWLLQHAVGDHGIAAAARCDSVYRVKSGHLR